MTLPMELVSDPVNTAAAPVIDTWVPGDVSAKRRAAARLFTEQRNGVYQSFRGGLEEMAELGLVELEPQGDRVLTVAILASDAVDGGLIQPEYNSRAAVIHKVITLGEGCARWYETHGIPTEKRMKPGDYVSILATVADRVSATDKTCRYWTTRIEHIGCRVSLRL